MTPKPSRDAHVDRDAVRPPAPSICDSLDVEARLLDVAGSDAVTELVVVLRGTVRPWRGPGRGLWRVQLSDGHHRIVSTRSVIAVTPVRTRASSGARDNPEDQGADH